MASAASGPNGRSRITGLGSGKVAPMAPLGSLLPLAAKTAAEEGKSVITAMLVVGLIFLGVIVLGELSRYLRHRRP